VKTTKYIVSLVLLFVLTASMVYGAQNQKVKSADLEWTFAGNDQEQLLIDVINSSKKTLDIAIYSLTDVDVLAAIKDAKKRGVSVRIITDKTQAGGKSQTEALKILGSAGIPTKINSHSGLMHIKMTIADNNVATTGSFNYSASASETNDEILMVIRNKDVAKNFTSQFESMWKDDKRYKTVEYKIGQDTVEKKTEDAADTKIDSKANAVEYANCDAVRKAGKAPLKKGQPGYSTKLDRDGDGVACEK
jgi:phosphatidylserine/phosphatidylglycerophosphate/cardiolipin synthase-like enzyme